ncbi:MAG: hypothetical protein IJ740_08515 [Ruminococcus sp.]|nr:hypothetical protein [Ruminococcus sp.]
MRPIDADALIDKICGECGVKNRETFCNAYCGDKKAVESMPTLDVEPVKHGRWFGTVCSNCGNSDCNYYDHDYCPFCGARMDGDVNGQH